MKVWSVWHSSKFKSQGFDQLAPNIALLVYVINDLHNLEMVPCLTSYTPWTIKCPTSEKQKHDQEAAVQHAAYTSEA